MVGNYNGLKSSQPEGHISLRQIFQDILARYTYDHDIYNDDDDDDDDDDGNE